MSGLFKTEDADMNISAGLISDTRSIVTSARRDDVTVGPEQPIIETTTGINPIFADLNGDTVYVRSDNALDTNIEVTVSGLDQNFNPFTSTVVLQGQTPVPLGGLWARLSSITNTTGVVSRQSTLPAKAHVGVLTVGNIGNTEIYLVSTPLRQSGRSSAISIPRGWEGFIYRVDLNMSKSTGTDTQVDVEAYLREEGGVFFNVFSQALLTSGSTEISIDFSRFPRTLPAKSDLIFRAKTSAQTADVNVLYCVKLVNHSRIISAGGIR